MPPNETAAPAAVTTIDQLRRPASPEASLPMIRTGFDNLQSWELMQRQCKALAASTLVPAQYQNNLPNCLIALEMAQRIGASPLMVMQNLYIVHGNPGWSAKFLIACINTSARFSALRYEWRGTPETDNYGCRAWAIEKDGGERLNGTWIDWKLVKAEKWHDKPGSKWKTMPDQMFIYRAAAFWQRAYAPEISMGLNTAEEMNDVFDATKVGGHFQVDTEMLRNQGAAAGAVNTDTGEVQQQNPITRAVVAAQIAAAESVEIVDLAMDNAAGLSAEDVAFLADEAAKVRARLTEAGKKAKK